MSWLVGAYQRAGLPGVFGVFVMTGTATLMLRRAVITTPSALANHEHRPEGSSLRCLHLRGGSSAISVPVWTLAVVAVTLVMSPVLAVGASALVLALLAGAPRRALRRQARAWAQSVPDLVELIRLALVSGCTAHLTLVLVAEHAGGAVAEMLDRTRASLREGVSTVDALRELQDRVGSAIRPLCSALIASERYGLPVASTLEALAVEARLARQRDAELRSRRLPVLLIFPLVLCILPAFALLTVVPLLGGGLSSLSW